MLGGHALARDRVDLLAHLQRHLAQVHAPHVLEHVPVDRLRDPGPRQWKDFLKCFVQLRGEDDFKFYGYVIAITPHSDLDNKQSVMYIFQIMRPHIYYDSVQDMRVHEIKVMISMQPGVPILRQLFYDMHRLQSRTKYREAEQWYMTWKVPRVDTHRVPDTL